MFGACHDAAMLNALLVLDCGPTQSSVMVTDPGRPSTQNTFPNSRRWRPVWSEPQSAGDAEPLNTQPVSNWTNGCGGWAVAGVPGRVRTAAVIVVARPSPLTACTVRKHRPPPTGG